MSLKTLGGLFNGKNKSHNQKKLDQCLQPVFRIREHYIMQIAFAMGPIWIWIQGENN